MNYYMYFNLPTKFIGTSSSSMRSKRMDDSMTLKLYIDFSIEGIYFDRTYDQSKAIAPKAATTSIITRY